MAGRRKRNPGVEDLQAGADGILSSSAAAIDLAYEEQADIKNEIRTLEAIKATAASEGTTMPAEGRGRLRRLKARNRELERKFTLYTNVMVKDMERRIKKIEDSPLASLRAREISKLKREIFNIKRIHKRGGDIRHPIAHAMGGVVLLERDTGPLIKEKKKTKSRAEKEQANLIGLSERARKRWGQIRKHAANNKRFFIPGSQVVHKEKGIAKVVDFDGRKATLRFDTGKDKKVGLDKIIPADVSWVDKQFDVFRRKARKGEKIVKTDIQRVVKKMKDIHNVSKPRAKLKTYAEANKSLGSLIGKIQTRLVKDKMDKEQVEAFILELDNLQGRIPSISKAEWSKADQRQWASDFRNVRKSLVKLRRRSNPCIGFHFHGKDADELLEAIEKSNARAKKKAVKKNPTTKRARKYGPGAEERKAKRNREKGYRIKREKKARKNPSGPKLKKNDLVVVRAKNKSGSAGKFYGRVTDVAKAGYGIREGDFFAAEYGKGKRALSLMHEETGGMRLRTGPRGRIWKVTSVKTIGHAKGTKVTGVDPRYRKCFARSNPTEEWHDEWADLPPYYQCRVRQADPHKSPGAYSNTEKAKEHKSKKWGFMARHMRGHLPDLKGYPYSTYVAAYKACKKAVIKAEEGAMSAASDMESMIQKDWKKRMPRSNPKKKASKKKATKKKATRKKTPKYQLQINRCQKLWEHYCERPSKKRLQVVLDHLDKMKESTSKKVKEERSRCLRVANKEARKLKMK